ncbi:hypothetical protein EJP75_08600 [Acinetobacter baumannii]|nr:hypothetical protein EJP75_08600 [Acinetobacter baumannii]
MDIQKVKELALANGFKLKEQASGNMDLNSYVYDFANAIEQAAKAQAVPKVAQRQGGYYIRDLRSQPGNCMKFWYQAGYGTKHKNFFWCATLEEAKEYKGGCDWFEIWHAPYIDSLVEYTVDFQLADRGVGLVDLKAQEQANDL